MKKILAIFVAIMLLANMATFTAFAEATEGINVTFVNAENSFLINGHIESERDRIPMTLHVTKGGQTLAVAETLAVGKTGAFVPFEFSSILLSATVRSGEINFIATTSFGDKKVEASYDYVGVDKIFEALKEIKAAQGSKTALKEKLVSTAATLRIDITKYNALSASSKNIVIEGLMADYLELNLPDTIDAEEDCYKVFDELVKYQEKYLEVIAVAEFFNLGTTTKLKSWYDNYKDQYGFLLDDEGTEEDETLMLQYFDEAIQVDKYLERRDLIGDSRTIVALNRAMKHQALLQRVDDGNQLVVKNIINDFKPLLTTIKYTEWKRLNSAQQSAVCVAVAGKYYPSITAFISAVNEAIEDPGDYSSGSTGGGGGAGGGGGGGFLVTNGEVTPTGTVMAFTDIGHVEWAHKAIYNLYTNGVINGKSPVVFAPDDSVTRAELVKMLVLGLNLKGSSNVTFKDVSSSAWYASYVSVAAANGLVTGDDNGNFNPNQKISRQDAATMMYRALGTSEKAAKAFFEDYASISSYARDAVDYMSAKGVINGVGDGMFAPKANLTRAAAAKMLYSLLTF